jgi:hypothetical protein
VGPRTRTTAPGPMPVARATSLRKIQG